MKLEDCMTERKQTPAEQAFDEVEKALAYLAEAVDRITMKTGFVRACQPYGTIPPPPNPDASPLVMKLQSIRDYVHDKASQLNHTTDEIEL